MNRIVLAALLVGTIGITACGSSDSGADTQAVTIDFQAMVGSQVFDCANTTGYQIGTGTQYPFVPNDLRFYVSNVRLVDAAGNEAKVTLDESNWQAYDVALLDFENGAGKCNVGTVETNTAIHGTVAPGTYVGLRFDVGVPAASNHMNPQAVDTKPPLNNTAMAWSWTTGYKFIKIQGLTRPAPTATNPSAVFTFNFHLGSVGCSVPAGGTAATATCSKPNVPAVDFPAFNPVTQAVVFDLQTLFAGSNFDVADAGGAAGCMSGEIPSPDMECAPIYVPMGLAFTSTPAVPQTAFRVASK